MKLEKALSNLRSYDCEDSLLSNETGNVCISSSDLKEGDIFICLKGGQEGKSASEEALKKGASVVVSEDNYGLKRQVLVDNSRSAYSLISKAVSGNACDKLKIIAVTGTNGKTTTTKIIGDILRQSGKRVGLIGTLGAGEIGESEETGFTTPDPDILHRIFGNMLSKGVEYVVMEASAHALALNKLDGINFEVAIFTNLTQDHLDFFGNMENYFEAKRKLFSSGRSKMGIVNIDDHYGKRLAEDYEIPTFKFSTKEPADIQTGKIASSFDGSIFDCILFDEKLNIQTELVGDYNIENLMGGILCAKLLGIGNREIEKFVKNISPAEGRFNKMNFRGANIIVDFAHTPDGLEKVLKTAKKITEGRLMCVFGCGGNRDRGKRPIMGKITEEICDKVFITSDNPRFEVPEEIISEIELGMQKENHVIYPDRAEAVCRALLECQKGDCLVIAGKGGEKYQDIGGVKHHYDDFEVIEEVVKADEMAKRREYAD